MDLLERPAGIPETAGTERLWCRPLEVPWSSAHDLGPAVNVRIGIPLVGTETGTGSVAWSQIRLAETRLARLVKNRPAKYGLPETRLGGTWLAGTWLAGTWLTQSRLPKTARALLWPRRPITGSRLLKRRMIASREQACDVKQSQ